MRRFLREVLVGAERKADMDANQVVTMEGRCGQMHADGMMKHFDKIGSATAEAVSRSQPTG
jgi:hypothetical protein